MIIDARRGLQALIDALGDVGYRVLGPTVHDGVIVYGDIELEAEIPSGYTATQVPGRWRMEHGDGPLRFSWTPAADSWKRFVFPAKSEVVRIRRTDGSFVSTLPQVPTRPLALIGARDCELRALDILDRVMLDPLHPDPRYASRRDQAFIVAVACAMPASTCWCTSMGGGPRPDDGFDLLITELPDESTGTGHRLMLDAGSARGREILQHLPATPATPHDRSQADQLMENATAMMPVRIAGEDLPRLLAGTEHHRQWDDVASRCLSCGNCTMVCPTCFCSTFSDHTTLDSDEAVREQSWVSCFQLDHSHLGGRPVRATTAARYRQWLTHKLQTWPEQFGSAGCVGCGRCTTWCPAGIDIVAEAIAISAGGDH